MELTLNYIKDHKDKYVISVEKLLNKFLKSFQIDKDRYISLSFSRKQDFDEYLAKTFPEITQLWIANTNVTFEFDHYYEGIRYGEFKNTNPILIRLFDWNNLYHFKIIPVREYYSYGPSKSDYESIFMCAIEPQMWNSTINKYSDSYEGLQFLDLNDLDNHKDILFKSLKIFDNKNEAKDWIKYYKQHYAAINEDDILGRLDSQIEKLQALKSKLIKQIEDDKSRKK